MPPPATRRPMAKVPLLLGILVLVAPVIVAEKGSDCPEAPGASSSETPPTCAYADTGDEKARVVAESALPLGALAFDLELPHADAPSHAPAPAAAGGPAPATARGIPNGVAQSPAAAFLHAAAADVPSAATSVHVEPGDVVPQVLVAAAAKTPWGPTGARVGERALREAADMPRARPSPAGEPASVHPSFAPDLASSARDPLDTPPPAPAPAGAEGAQGPPIVPVAVAGVPAPLGPVRVPAWAAAAGGAAFIALAPLLLALYHRIAAAEATRHATRARILEELAAGPATATTLGERLGIDRTSAAHHLRVLERARFVACVRAGRERLWTTGAAGLQPLGAGARRVLHAVRGSPGASLSDVARAVGVSKSTVHHHLLTLAAADLVRVVRRGRALALEATALPGEGRASPRRPSR